MESKFSSGSDGNHNASDALNECLARYEQAAIDHADATTDSDYRKANLSHDIIRGIVAQLKESGEILQLRKFLVHRSQGVRVWAASHLLPTALYEEAISTLKEIAKGSDMIAFAAEMTLREWQNGRLKL